MGVSDLDFPILISGGFPASIQRRFNAQLSGSPAVKNYLRRSSGGGSWLQCNLVAEALKSADELTLDACSVAFVEK